VTFALTDRPQTDDRRLRIDDERDPSTEIRNPQLPKEGESEIQRWSVKLDFIGANPNVRPIGQDKTEAVISYFKGPQDQWHAGLPTYGSIIYPTCGPALTWCTMAR